MNSTEFLSPVLLIVIPLLFAFISIIKPTISMYLLMITTLFNVVSVWFVQTGITLIGGFEVPFGITLYVDEYTLIIVFVLNLLMMLLGVLIMKDYQRFGTVLLVSLVGLNGMILTADLFNLFVMMEVASIAAFITTFSHHQPEKTFIYVVYGVLGSVLYVLGLVMMYAMTGTLNLFHMMAQIETLNMTSSALVLPFLLMFLGLSVEAKLLPLNTWVHGILKHANTMTGPLIASLYALVIGFVFGRLLTNLFVFEGTLQIVVFVILGAGIILAEVMAFESEHPRAILLYSSMAQASLAMLLFLVGLTEWAMALIVLNAISKFVLFSYFSVIKHSKGTFRHHPVTGVAVTIIILSMIGLPLFVGFFVKVNYLIELTQLELWVWVVVIIASAVIEGIYYVRLLIQQWYEEGPAVSISKVFTSVAIFFALLVVLFGIYPMDSLDGALDQVDETMEVLFP